MNPEPERITLGQTGIQVSPMGVGTNIWNVGQKTGISLRAVFDAALEAGINLFDTAEVYNFGGSERAIGQFLPAAHERTVITSKFMPYPLRLAKGSLQKALHASLGRLGIDRVDLYLVHFPLPPLPLETWAEALGDAVEAGLVRAVGVSICGPDQLRRAHGVLARRGIPLACIQVEYSLLKRGPENGLLALCADLGVTLVAYRPLSGGLLSGRYTPQNRPGGIRGLMVNNRDYERAQPVVALLRQIGEAHGGKTTSQVALNWVICKGALPIPGASKVQNLQQNAGALGWRLSTEEVQALDQVSSIN